MHPLSRNILYAAARSRCPRYAATSTILGIRSIHCSKLINTPPKQSPPPLQQPSQPLQSPELSVRSQRRQDIEIVRKMLPNVWPKDDRGTKTRVVIALGLLVAGKLLNVQVPYYFKSIVDSLNIPIQDLDPSQTVWVLAGTAIVGCMCLYVFLSAHDFPVI